MAVWLYTNNVVAEAPFAWSPLMERYKLNRAISTFEISPGIYQETRFDSYTDERDILESGLHYFRGGYEHYVDDAVKDSLLNSNVATEANFTFLSGTVPSNAINLNVPAEEF